MKTIIALAALTIIAAAPATAQTHNPEDRWIERSIRQQARSEHRADRVHHRRQAEPKRHHAAPQRHAHARPHVQEHDATRVYGIVTRKHSPIVRDATGHIECFPAIEARSHERQSEATAWDDAQRSWQNTVRWKYGERYQAIQFASAVEKRCNVSTVSESVSGKLVETARGLVTGDDNGRRWRCEIRANPCMAPVEFNPVVKGDPDGITR